jgi:hypothetical protein
MIRGRIRKKGCGDDIMTFRDEVFLGKGELAGWFEREEKRKEKKE